MTSHEFRTVSGVRLRPVAERPGDRNWLLLPGGPGIGSESLHGRASREPADGAAVEPQSAPPRR